MHLIAYIIYWLGNSIASFARSHGVLHPIALGLANFLGWGLTLGASNAMLS